MPLLDHFRPPLSERRHWEAFHSRWASAIADDLNEQGLPQHFFAEPTVHIGSKSKMNVATAPPSPAWILPSVFSDTFEVHIINSEGGPKLVAAIELVSPSNKDRPQTRRAFAIKCANYLCQGIPCIVMDVVTSRAAYLHNEIMELMQSADHCLPADVALYATAYRPVSRETREEIDVWPATLQIGVRLPSLPLFLGADLSLLIDFEASYQETCQRLRLVA